MNDMIVIFSVVFLTFSIKGVILTVAVTAGTAVMIGVMLGVAGKFFGEEVDETEAKVRELLPGNNCGGCGYPGCDNLAKAIAEGTAPVNACPVGRSTHAAIAELMGVSTQDTERQVAFVKCKGTCDKTKQKYQYEGLVDCKKVTVVPGHGDKVCTYGCMGYGSCVRVCAFDAMKIVNGIAYVDKEKCTACGMCIKECPNAIISLVPYRDGHRVGCSSKDKGVQVRKACSVGCIACMICVKACEYDAITVKDNLACIDYDKCTNCGKCAEKCPQKIITIE